MTRGNHELWEEHAPTPTRRDTNSPPLRKERALFGPLSDLQAPVRHSLLLREVRPRPPSLTSVMLEMRSLPACHRGIQEGFEREKL